MPKKGKGLAVDFKHRKAKVGKHKLLPTNATIPNLKFKSLDIRPTALSGDAAIELESTFNDLIRTSRNHNAAMRKEALYSLKSLLEEHEGVLDKFMGQIINVMADRIADPDENVRNTLFVFASWFAGAVTVESIKPFLPLFTAYVISAMSTLDTSLRFDALALVFLFMQQLPDITALIRDAMLPSVAALLDSQVQTLTSRSFIGSLLPAEFGIGTATAATTKVQRVKMNAVEGRVAAAHVLTALLAPREGQEDVVLDAMPDFATSVLVSPDVWDSKTHTICSETTADATSPGTALLAGAHDAATDGDGVAFTFTVGKHLTYLCMELAPAEVHAAEAPVVQRLAAVVRALEAVLTHGNTAWRRAGNVADFPFSNIAAFMSPGIAEHMALKKLSEVSPHSTNAPTLANLLVNALVKQLIAAFPFTTSSTDASSHSSSVSRAIYMLNSRVCSLITLLCPHNLPFESDTSAIDDGPSQAVGATGANLFMSLLPRAQAREILAPAEAPIEAITNSIDARYKGEKRKRAELPEGSSGKRPRTLDSSAPAPVDYLPPTHQDVAELASTVVRIDMAVIRGFAIKSNDAAEACALSVDSKRDRVVRAMSDVRSVIKRAVRWAASLISDVTDLFSTRVTDTQLSNDARHLALVTLLQYYSDLVRAANSVSKKLSNSLLSDISKLFQASPMRSATKVSCTQFVVRALLAAGQPRAVHLPPATVNEWLTQLPRCIWGFGATFEAAAIEILTALMARARAVQPRSADDEFFRSLSRQFAPIFHTLKTSGTERSGVFGPFRDFPPAVQIQCLSFLRLVGGLTPALRRGMLVCCLALDENEMCVDTFDALIEMSGLDICGPTPLALVHSDLLRDLITTNVSSTLSVLFACIVEASYDESGGTLQPAGDGDLLQYVSVTDDFESWMTFVRAVLLRLTGQCAALPKLWQQDVCSKIAACVTEISSKRSNLPQWMCGSICALWVFTASHSTRLAVPEWNELAATAFAKLHSIAKIATAESIGFVQSRFGMLPHLLFLSPVDTVPSSFSDSRVGSLVLGTLARYPEPLLTALCHSVAARIGTDGPSAESELLIIGLEMPPLVSFWRTSHAMLAPLVERIGCLPAEGRDVWQPLATVLDVIRASLER